MDVSLTPSGIALGLMITMWRRKEAELRGHRDSQGLGQTRMYKFGNIHLQRFSKSQSARGGLWQFPFAVRKHIQQSQWTHYAVRQVKPGN